MIVRLSDHPRRVIRNRIDGVLAEAWDAGITKATGYRYDVMLPAIAWRRIMDVLEGEVIGVRGGYSREARTRSLVTAYTVVMRALNARVYHPAMFGRGVAGHVTESIPAWEWRRGGDERLWSPYPVSGAPFVVLRPVPLTSKGLRITTWRPCSPDPERVLEQEVEHLVFGVDVGI